MNRSKVRDVNFHVWYDPFEDSLTVQLGWPDTRVQALAGDEGVDLLRDEKSNVIVGVRLRKYKYRMKMALGEDCEFH